MTLQPHHNLVSFLISYPRGQHFPGSDQASDRGSLHLPHHVAAMQLYRDYADAEVERDLLVKAAIRHFSQNLTFACGEGVEPLEMLLHNPLFYAPGDIALDRGFDRIEQALVAERLRKEINRTGLHRLDRHWNVGVSGEKYDWLRFATDIEVSLEIEATQSRQTHVQDQASGPLVGLGFK